ASAHPSATKAGIEILRNGGNAYDAAVTVSAVLSVVEPYSSGMGGGGFWLLHDHKNKKQVMIDGREKAPFAAHRDMYLDSEGKFDNSLSIDGALAAGIPGQAAALVHLADNYGQLSLTQTLQPAIDLARNGFVVDEYYQKMAGWRLSALQNSIAASEIFLQDDQVPQKGYFIKQPELANTLQQLATKGFDGFYKGSIAEALVRGVRDAGGIWTMEDLAAYRVVEREPVRFTYKDKTITSAALPSSGGIVMAQIFNMLSEYDLKQLDSVKRIHLIVEAMRRAYRDRADYLGDSDFVEVPVNHLLSRQHAAYLASDIDLNSASNNDTLVHRSEGMDTTHFSIVDNQGNRVSATLSINYPFGSGFMPAGTGVLLNDEMDDFSASPGEPNVYGLVGSEANAIEAGKRMLSSMSPTMVEDDQGIAILGTPGGSRIITMVALAILEMEKTSDPEAWVNLPRYHHQYLPDMIQYEPEALSGNEAEQLKGMGHKLKRQKDSYGNMHAIYQDKRSGKITAASDKRGIGLAISANQ
ncbi:MAG: gamma-glutamyltransferase, partial [Gammaproteobacteria bacterium]|nr:gamma-glutamyltransferase [Gammaproteobacteria bacterium]